MLEYWNYKLIAEIQMGKHLKYLQQNILFLTDNNDLKKINIKFKLYHLSEI